MTFQNVFGGGSLAPADVAYRAVSLTANVTLVWPPLATTTTDFVARIMDVTPSAGSKAITMPPANQVSAGFDVLYANPSAFTYTVLDNTGSTIATVAAGQYVYLFLTDNSTVAGTWKSFVYGVGTGSLSAASVQGYGIVAIASTLNAQRVITTKSANYTVATTDRASTLVWTGGAGTFTLPAAANALQGFFFDVRNAGTGTLTIAAAGADTTDGATSIALQPTDSLIEHSDGVSAWYSVGRGRSTVFNFSQLTKSVDGGTDTLTTTEAASNLQTYTGILLSNQIIVIPAVVNVYYVSNQTTGAFSLTVQTPTPGTTVSVPSGQNAILITDGTNVINASTTLSGLSSFTLNAGSAAAPTLTFSGDTDTGLFQPVANTIGFAAGGSEVVRFKTGGIDTVNGTVALPSYSFRASLSTGVYSPSANQLAIAQNGVQAILVSGSQQVTIGNVNITGGAISGVTLANLVRFPRTANAILVAADSGNLIDITSGTFTQTFTAAATLGSGWNVYYKNSGTGEITIPSSDGVSNWIMYPQETRLFTCNGTNFFSTIIHPFYQAYTANATFTKPPGYKYIGGLLWGGGTSGEKSGGAGLARGGGGGGCFEFKLPMAALGATTAITVAALATGSHTAGNPTSFGTLIVVFAGTNKPDGGGIKVGNNLQAANGFDGAESGGAATFGLGAVYGGSAASNDATQASGTTIYGGAAGGGVDGAGTLVAAGTSKLGGNGGAAGDAASGVDGTAPGGGGGGTRTGAKSGDGARGEAQVWGVV